MPIALNTAMAAASVPHTASVGLLVTCTRKRTNTNTCVRARTHTHTYPINVPSIFNRHESTQHAKLNEQRECNRKLGHERVGVAFQFFIERL
jgi:hypothetical protein